MTLVDRVRNICINPNAEWPVIEQESTQSAELVTGYLAPLAALGAIAGLIGSTMLVTHLPFGRSLVEGVFAGLVGACVSFVTTIGGCFAIAYVINALAPTFGGRQDSTRAFKVAVYAYTPGLVAGVLRIFPVLSILISIVAGLYGLYLLYLGLPTVMKAPREKAAAYTVVVVLSTIVLGFVASTVLALFAEPGIAGTRRFLTPG